MSKSIMTKVPISFEKIKDYLVKDTRFTKVKIYVLHTGLNLNNSIFNKDVIDEAIPSLYNTPILAYVEKNDDGIDDFSDHRQELSIENDQMKITYKCIPFGVIGESCNPRYETYTASDGIERTYLVVDGLVWNKIEHSDIFSRDSIKDASMELSENYQGYFDKDGHFVFTKIEFDGICGLGNGVQPAMRGASIEVNFTLNEIQAKLEQFNRYFHNQPSTDVDNTNHSEKGGTTLMDEIKYREVVEDNTVKTDDIVEEFKSEVDEPLTDEVLTDDATVDVNSSYATYNTTNTIDDTSETEFLINANFSTTYKQKREALQNALVSSVEKDENDNVIFSVDYWLEDFDDQYVYVKKYTWENGDANSESGRLSYTFNEKTMTATIDSDFEKMIVTWVTIEENEKLQSERIEYARLVQFEKDTLAAERNAALKEIFSNFDEKLSNVEAYSKLKENCENLSIEDIEDKCFALVGKLTTKFSTKKKDEKVVKLDFEVLEVDDTDDGYGGILSSKYGKY